MASLNTNVQDHPTQERESLTRPTFNEKMKNTTPKITLNDSHLSTSVRVPLLSASAIPPLARLDSEVGEDDEDNREVASQPYPGVDDGFFSPPKPVETPNTDVELLPRPSAPRDEDMPPSIGPRAGGDGDDAKDPKAPDEPDGKVEPPTSGPPSRRPSWPSFNVPSFSPPEKPYYPPGFGPDVEGGVAGSLPDINVYQHRKTLAQGMMDLALLSANANQLRYVLESYRRHPYFYPSIVLVGLSLILQVLVGMGLIWNARYNVKDEREICIANKINNFTIIGIFLVTVINVFISAFGVADAPS